MKRSLFAFMVLFVWQGVQAAGPGSSGVWKSKASDVIVKEDFESADRAGLPQGYQLRKDPDKDRSQVLFGEVTKENQALKYLVPFEKMGKRKLSLSFFARSPDRCRCALWVSQEGQKRRLIEYVAKLPGRWEEFEMNFTVPTDAPGTVEIVLPSSFGAPPGKAFLDDLELQAAEDSGPWLAHQEDFPAMCLDGEGGLWLAVTARPDLRPQLTLYRIDGPRRSEVLVFRPEGLTGIGAPDIAPWSKGCVVTVPVERKGVWEVACLFIDRGNRRPQAIHYLNGGGRVNIQAALDVRGDTAVVVWQSNKTFPRRVCTAAVAPERAGEPHLLSAVGMPANNPDVVFVDHATAFAAWDSFDGDSVNIYGCYRRNGSWGEPKRMTSDPRMERHVHLAAREGALWMAWQAHAFKNHLINNVFEQRVCAARVSQQGLKMAPGLFESISPPEKRCLRPFLAFTGDGDVILSLRESLGAHTGWRALAWNLSSGPARGPLVLWQEPGRWRPVAMALHKGRLAAACQRDNLPSNWGIDTGLAPDWRCEVAVVEVPSRAAGAAAAKLIPLAMPATDFSLPAHIEKFSAKLPRATRMHNGKKLTLFWGDMHEHSDLSVCQRAANPPVDDLWANQRDIEFLDFTAITDHGYNLDHPQWQYSAERVRAHFDAERFISLLAEEWTSDHVQYEPKRSVRRYGHHNLVFLDTSFPKFYDSRDNPFPTPRQVWDDIGDAEFISIPHQLADTGNSPTDWTYHDEHHQPLAEIFQQRESYEYYGAPRQSRSATPFKGHYLQDAWALGLVIGVIASPDHGGSKGNAAVWAEEPTRESLFKAFHARNTFGTSGAKMNLWVSSGDVMMGDKTVRRQDSIPFTISASADRPISKVIILRNNSEVFTATPRKKEVEVNWTDTSPPKDTTLWYYVRIHRDDEELAWSSPIWFFTDEEEMRRTVQQARELPQLHPHGPPAADPGPSVNWRKKLKRGH
ncbi:MAG: DUF3604 domain-containing protein [Kiritimatiellia bacterium]|nr:DUF3604 domain-containing protein [Kiritimatiellia bacterium]